MIIENQGFIWVFKSEDQQDYNDFERQYYNYQNFHHHRCENCNMILHSKYSMIMNDLDEANLLPKDYEHFCCLCSFFKKVDLLHLKKYFMGWDLVKEIEGELIIIQERDNSANIVLLAFYLLYGKLEILIHDYKKFLFS